MTYSPIYMNHLPGSGFESAYGLSQSEFMWNHRQGTLGHPSLRQNASHIGGNLMATHLPTFPQQMQQQALHSAPPSQCYGRLSAAPTAMDPRMFHDDIAGQSTINFEVQTPNRPFHLPAEQPARGETLVPVGPGFRGSHHYPLQPQQQQQPTLPLGQHRVQVGSGLRRQIANIPVEKLAVQTNGGSTRYPKRQRTAPVAPYSLPGPAQGITQRQARRAQRSETLPSTVGDGGYSQTGVIQTQSVQLVPGQGTAVTSTIPRSNIPTGSTSITPLATHVPRPVHSIMADTPADLTSTGTAEHDELLALSMAHDGTNDVDLQHQPEKRFEPEFTGPLVGKIQPSTAITSEYAAADPVYRAKTAALPQKYSHYRTVRGDGKCGWRAIAFGYFEALIRQNSANVFFEEQTRMLLLRSHVAKAGTPIEFSEEFFDEATDLLKKLAEGLPTGDAETVLLDTFNEDSTQQYLVFCMKLLTASWIATHQAEYAPYMETETVEQFCEYIKTIDSEIDHKSLTALHAILLSPIDIALEVLYLDRSEGSEVNAHQWEVAPGTVACGHVRLLYRPGHYDILYKQEDVRKMVEKQPPITTFLQHSTTSYNWADVNLDGFDQPFVGISGDFGCDLDFDMGNVLLQVPGMSFMNGKPDDQLLFGSNMPMSQSFLVDEPVSALPSVPASTQDLDLRSVPTFTPSEALDSSLVMGYAPLQHDFCDEIHPTVPNHIDIASINPPAPIVRQTTLPHHPANFRDPFRKSVVQYKHESAAGPVAKVPQPPLRTKQMLQSPCSEAHFQNPEFQPITYDPANPDASEGQHGGAGVGHFGRSSRHRSRK